MDSIFGVRIAKLFGPEHGFLGAAQDMEGVSEASCMDPLTGAEVYSLYGDDEASLRPTPAMFADLDVLVVDLQDIGARYYTYAATMGYALEVAAEIGLRVVVLDRPNPLGGEVVEGPRLHRKFHSFVGAYNLPIRHGLTLGEYARFVVHLKKLELELEVVQMVGWSRDMDFEATDLPWVLPSPNMPTVDTAWIYPGQCLFEGTNLSEGRGTTRPFELVGAPFLDGAQWADAVGSSAGPGVVLRPTAFRPTFQKHAGQDCGGLQIHVVDRVHTRSLRLAVSLLHAARTLAPEAFGWRTETYEFVSDRLAIDLLFGSSRPREMMEAGASVEEIVTPFAWDETEFLERRRPFLLY